VDQPDGKSPEISSEVLAGLFRRASRLMARAAHRLDHGGPGHAGHAQERVLAIVRQRGGMSQRELLELLDVRSASLSEVLAKLERNGLIARRRDDADRRGFTVAVTDKGEAACSGQADLRRESAAALFAGLDPAERETLGRLLAKLVASLEEDQRLRGDCAEPAEGFGPEGRERCGGHAGGPGRHLHGLFRGGRHGRGG
jgi:DNA-binding MarR family transcriptional regulator